MVPAEPGLANWTISLPRRGLGFTYHAAGPRRKMPGVWGLAPKAYGDTGACVASVVRNPATRRKCPRL